MKIVTLIARILLGLVFLIFGLNGFFDFIPHGPMPGGLAGEFIDVLSKTQYQHVVCAIQLISAILFFANRFVPLALVLIGPVIVNILLFHLFLGPASIGPGVVVTILWFIVFYHHRSAFEGIFQAKA